MNEQIKQLAEQVVGPSRLFGGDFALMGNEQVEKFGKLIVQECYEHCKDQLMDKKLAEEAGLDYNDGVMDCAIGLKQHFGVE